MSCRCDLSSQVTRSLIMTIVRRWFSRTILSLVFFHCGSPLRLQRSFAIVSWPRCRLSTAATGLLSPLSHSLVSLPPLRCDVCSLISADSVTASSRSPRFLSAFFSHAGGAHFSLSLAVLASGLHAASIRILLFLSIFSALSPLDGPCTPDPPTVPSPPPSTASFVVPPVLVPLTAIHMRSYPLFDSTSSSCCRRSLDLYPARFALRSHASNYN